MDMINTNLSAKEAIGLAFERFDEFFENVRNNVLLEEVEYLSDSQTWKVTIGFDSGRSKETSSTLGFGQVVKEPLREFRSFFIRDEDGSFVRMQ